MAIVFKINGKKQVVKLPSVSDADRLKKLQKLVGGYIEVLYREGNRVYLGNEDGLSLGLPPNPFFPQFVGNVVCVQTPKEFN